MAKIKFIKPKKTENKPSGKAIENKDGTSIFFVPGYGNIIAHDEVEAQEKANEIIKKRKEP